MDENSTGKEVKTEAEERCGTHNMCRPHTSLYLSIIALLLAAYAAITAGSSVTPNDGEARLTQLESNLQSLTEQVASLGKDVESNRENLIQTKLKKALLNIREVGDLAKEETKATIAEVEKVLRSLTSLEKATTPATETDNTPAPESKPETVTPDTAEPEAASDPITENPAVEEAVDQQPETAAETAPEITDSEAEAPATKVPAEPTEAPAAVMPEAQAF